MIRWLLVNQLFLLLLDQQPGNDSDGMIRNQTTSSKEQERKERKAKKGVCVGETRYCTVLTSPRQRDLFQRRRYRPRTF